MGVAAEIHAVICSFGLESCGTAGLLGSLGFEALALGGHVAALSSLSWDSGAEFLSGACCASHLVTAVASL